MKYAVVFILVFFTFVSLNTLLVLAHAILFRFRLISSHMYVTPQRA